MLKMYEIKLLIKGSIWWYFFLFFIENVYCDPSSEPSRRDGSDEGSQHMFLAELTKNFPNYNKYSLLSIALMKAFYQWTVQGGGGGGSFNIYRKSNRTDLYKNKVFEASN